MSNCVAFHTQIASIMEVLANAAVAEICQVVDDGYAVLRLEVSQYQKENKALKRRLLMLERQSARRCVERGAPRASFADGAQLCRNVKVRETPRAKGHFPAAERALDNRIDVGLKTDEQPIVLDEEDAPALPTGRSDAVTSRQTAASTECADMDGGKTESLLIKEERLKEKQGTPVWQGEPGSGGKGEADLEVGNKGGPASTETQPAAAKRERLPEQPAEAKLSAWDVSALQPGREAESEQDSTKSLQHHAPELKTRRLSSLDSEFVMFERPGPLGSYGTPGGAVAETEDPCCSYSGPQSLSYHSEMRSYSAPEGGGGNGLSPLGTLDWKPDIVVVDSAPVKVETELPAVWSAGPVLGVGNAQQRAFEEIGPRGEMLSESASNVCLPPLQMTAAEKAAVSKFAASESDEPRHRADGGEKRLFYSYFQKGFGRTADGEVPQSVDAEERQFSCAQCGKLFAHSANLKRHQRVHTGEKPFSCTQCEKRFSHQHQLKMHQRVHTGERPFNCTHCGKRFTQSSHIKRHLLVHTGEML